MLRNSKRILQLLIISVVALKCESAQTPVVYDPVENALESVTKQGRCTIAFAGEDQLIGFLNQQKTDRTNPECIERAIVKLGSLRTPKAAPILTEFLDFPMPLTAEKESQRMLIASTHNGSRYKAVETLYDIGGPALPSIMGVIRDRSGSPIKLKNALDAYLLNSADTPANARKLCKGNI